MVNRLQYFLAYGTAAQPLYHMQNFVLITLLEFGWKQNEIAYEFELWWEKSSVKWSSVRPIWLVSKHIAPSHYESLRATTHIYLWVTYEWQLASISQKVYKLIIQILKKKMSFSAITMIQSSLNFADVTTAQLSWHVQNCDLIGSSK